MIANIRHLIKKPRVPRRHKNKRPALNRAPQRKGNCLKVFVMAPRKPNSAKRKVARIWIPSTKKTTNVFIPGIGHNLQRHSAVWIRGGRVRDLPGIKYRAIRGKGDLRGLNNRIHSRSKYGAKRLLTADVVK
jgi:small subunit ribosomal protein S12